MRGAVVAELGSELFVKPAVNGSSYGVSCVHSAAELMPAIERAAEHGGKVLVEQRLVGTEITVGVYDAPDALRALPVVEIRQQENAEFYDLNVKYIDPAEVHRIPAPDRAGGLRPRPGARLPRPRGARMHRVLAERLHRYVGGARYFGDQHHAGYGRIRRCIRTRCATPASRLARCAPA